MKLMSLLTEELGVGGFSALNGLRDYNAKSNYLQSTLGLRPIGEGTGRLVFDVGDNRVLKLAKTTQAYKYNANEHKLFHCNEQLGRKYLAQVLENAPDFSWIVMEKVQPVSGEEDLNARLNHLTGSDVFSDMIGIGPMIERGRKKGAEATRNPYMTFFVNLIKSSPWFKGLATVLMYCNISSHDLKPENWGTRSSGELVILDYGFENGVL